MPWWGAVLIAVTATAIGFAYDAGSGEKQLTSVFASLYFIGCLTAVLAVRQSGIFTAVVQPPLILFVSVPGAYWLFHGAQVTGLKDILINCGYPLIERFLLMLFASATVLLVGFGRWYVGATTKRAAVHAEAEAKPEGGRLAAFTDSLTTKMSGIFSPDSDDFSAESDDKSPRRRHAIDRPSTAAAVGARGARAPRRAEATRSRHTRPPLSDIVEPPIERPRRQRATAREAEPREPRRRRAVARDPYERRDSYERRAPHERRSRYDSADAFEPYEAPQRRRPGTNGSYPNSTTHHPISRVRYRGSDEDDDSQPEYRARSRSRSRSWEAESWEYDI